MTPQAEYDFQMLVVEKDLEGYYYTRWDRATPLTVRAANRSDAFQAAWAVMGECRHGWTWTAQIQSITAAPVAASSASEVSA